MSSNPTIAQIPRDNDNFIIRNPGGSIGMGQLSNQNPYTILHQESSREDLEYNDNEYINIQTLNGLNIRIPIFISEKAFILEKMGKSVRFCSGVDIFFSLLYVLTLNSLIFVLGIFGGLFGYYGAKMFKKSLIFVYLIYLCLVSVWYFMSPFILKSILSEEQQKNYDFTRDYVYSFIAGFIELLIASFVLRFWLLLPKNSHDRNALLNEINFV